MSYVIYTQATTALERPRTPLGKVAKWVRGQVAGTILSEILLGFTHSSQVVRFATGIVVAFVLGLVPELFAEAFGLGLTTAVVCVGIGVIAGAAAQGGSGALIGGAWGWLIGALTDSITSQLLSEPLQRLQCKFAAWIISGLVGWAAGRIVSRYFEKWTRKHGRVRRVVERLFLTLALSASAVLGYSIGVWIAAERSSLEKDNRGLQATDVRQEIESFLRKLPFIPSVQVGERIRKLPDKTWKKLVFGLNTTSKTGWMVWGAISFGIGAIFFIGKLVAEAPPWRSDVIEAAFLGLAATSLVASVKVAWFVLRLIVQVAWTYWSPLTIP